MLSGLPDEFRLPGGHWGVALAVVIAVAKALLIMFYFMHLKSDPSRPTLFAAAGFVWLAILMVLTFCDFATR